MKEITDIYNKLKEYNQEHLLNFFDELNEEERLMLLKQIKKIDLEQTKMLFEQTKIEKKFESNIIEPLEYIDKNNLEYNKKNEYLAIGKNIIKQNKYAVVTMAGGQGTRLGHQGPKGTFNIGLKSNKSIFEILCDILKEANKKYNVNIPWYIMTSEENDSQTKKFFNENDYFHYGSENIKFFIQGKLPMLDINGRIIMDNKYTIKEAADGHGGIFEALNKSNIIEEMKNTGVEWIYIGGVDNIIAQLVDPIFLGITVKEKKVSAGKSVIKVNPDEKVGLFCKKDGKPSVIEYTEISDELRNKRAENGELLFAESNLLCNLFNIKVLEKIKIEKLPYHVAFKKAQYIDTNGELVNPIKENAYKFESFIFDAFEDLDNMIVVRGKREEEFAPVKNKEGVDSPETARKMYEALH